MVRYRVPHADDSLQMGRPRRERGPAQVSYDAGEVERLPRWPSYPPRGYLGQLEDECQVAFRSERSSLSLQDCNFYHTSVLRDTTVIPGAWDLRGVENSYLGNLEGLAGARVLELGPASGHLSFFMEDKGASVVSFEVGFDRSIDLLPSIPRTDMRAERAQVMSSAVMAVNNSWWYLHKDRSSSAKMVYGNIYEMPGDLGVFDAAIFGSILLHLRDPFMALEEATRRTTRSVVVTEPYYEELDGEGANVMRFAPESGNRGISTLWWNLTPGAVANMLDRLGFDVAETTHYTVKHHLGHHLDQEPVDLRMFTVVGTRPS